MVTLPYIDAEIERMDAGGEPPGYLRHFHWGHYDAPDDLDDDPQRYFTAAEAMTERVVAAGEVGDGRRVLDVGCGFGGTLDHIRGRNPGCRLAGINIDERQLQWARRLMGDGPDAVSFVTADGCQLPVASGVCDHVLAVECVFHFPSRKRFFREAARALKPGGTLALSDFLMGGPVTTLAANVQSAGLGEWYGRSATPLTSAGYERLGRSVGMELLVDDDVTGRTLPTYPALRRLYRESGSEAGVTTVDAVERLALGGGWQYHVLAFRKVADGPGS
jgi:SAM-dependent methyltransferase